MLPSYAPISPSPLPHTLLHILTLPLPHTPHFPAHRAGETVRGTLQLTTTKPIKCRAVRIRWNCKSVCHWHRGSGDDRKDYHGSLDYGCSKQTLFGNFFPTTVLDGAGKDAIYDAMPGSGDMKIPINAGTLSQSRVAIRVMDYDWGKKDDLLGEILVDANALVQQQAAGGGAPLTFNLMSKGKQGKGTITLSISILDNNLPMIQPDGQIAMSAQVLYIRCHNANGLKSGDWIGKNDVYIQSYLVPLDTPANKAVPKPEAKIVLPVAQYNIPFYFDIPGNVPGSAVLGAGDYSYVSHSIFSNIDISWKRDPSARRHITVLSGSIFPPPALLQPAMTTKIDSAVFGCDCCGCCKCCAKGSAELQFGCDRSKAPTS